MLAGNFTVRRALNKWDRFNWDGANLGAPHYFLLECQGGWLVICFDNDTPTVSEAAESLHGSLNDISGIKI